MPTEKTIPLRGVCSSLLFALVVLGSGGAKAAPGDVLFSDGFEDGTLSPWSAVFSADRVGVNDATAQSGSYSMYVRWDLDAALSPTIAADVPQADLTLWIRRGDDRLNDPGDPGTTSETPEAGEDLYLQYLDDEANWQTLQIFPGDGPAGEIFTPTYPLPSDARHSGLRLRAVLLSGSGEDFDYWHIDNVTVTEGDPYCESGASLSDSFEDGSLDKWKVKAQGRNQGDAGVDQRTAGDGTWSAFVGEYPVRLESPKVDLKNAISADLSLWIRRGADSFSEYPEAGDNVVLEYRNDGNQWIELATFSGGGTPGRIFEPSYSLPADARHRNFQLRLRMEGGSGAGFDYWHIDNVCLTSVGGGKADHYSISHDGSAVSCAAEPITITAHNNGDNPVDPGNVTIELDALNQATGNGEGTWARVLGGTGTLTDATAGDGAGQYTFPGGESSVTLAFNYTSVSAATDPETVNFDVNSGQTEPTEDPDLVISRSGFRITDGAGNPINVPTQIAGKSSDVGPGAQSLGLQAIRTSDGDPSRCEPAYPDGTTVEVELGAECTDPATCAGSELAVTNDGNTTAIDTSNDDGGAGAASYEAVNLLFGANAEASLALDYPDAGEVQLHARDNPIDDATTSPPVVEYISGSSNNFVVRPFGFYVDFDSDNDNVYDDRASNAGCGDQTSCAADATGDIFATADADFSARIAAVVYQSVDDGNGDGRPDGNAILADNDITPNFGQENTAETVDFADTLVAPSPGTAGSLANATAIGGFSAGARTITNLRYSEVGIIDLDATLSDGAYLGTVDVTGAVANVGRFIPADFAVAVREAGMYAATCNATFTYTGQAFGYSIRPRLDITARSAGGATTRNYRAGFIKLTGADVGVTPPTNDASAVGNVSGTTDVAVTSSLNTGAVADDGDGDALGNGTIVYTFDGGDRYTYDKVHNARIAPFDAELPITVDGITDGDGVSDGDLPSPNPFTPSGVELRFGRLLIDDAFGPEVAPVEQRWRIETWQGANWARNADDGCTSLALASDVQLDGDGGTQPGDATVTLHDSGGTGETAIVDNALDVSGGAIGFTSGTAAVRYAPPGEDERGWIGVASVLGADHHLLIDDNDDGGADGPYDANPSARVTFGVFAGESENIYLREVFPAP